MRHYKAKGKRLTNVREELVKLLAKGVPGRIAVELLGFHTSTWYIWKRRYGFK